MIAPAHLLPPNATALEKALSLTGGARLATVPVAVDRLWNPATCPTELLPWLAWGLSIDVWDSDWDEATKRTAIADAIEFQRRKGTPASLRTVLDRIDPLIEIVEWHEQRDLMEPYHFWVTLPFLADSGTVFDDALVGRILRDIVKIKPVRAAMTILYRLRAEARAALIAAAAVAGQARLDQAADMVSAIQPIWDTYLQTEDGEPIVTETGAFMECD